MSANIANRPAATVFSARAVFALAGFAVAAWAPLAPHVKAELNLTHAELSHYILLMGTGSIVGMAAITPLLRRLMLRAVLTAAALLLLGGLALCIALPSRPMAAAAIFSFGFGLGILEVGGNIYAAYLEQRWKRTLLSSMHGCYSAGEIAALCLAMLLLTFDFSLYAAIFAPTAILALGALSSLRHLDFDAQAYSGSTDSSYALPRGVVLLFALVSSLIYMVEGGMLDWSALLLLQKTDIELALASSGYIILITAMAGARFAGSYALQRFGTFKVLSVSVLCCALALIGLFWVHSLPAIYACFMVLGISIANIMPICISLSGRQRSMPVLAAISAVSTCGYGALIIGPALIGYLAEHLTLNGAFCALGCAVLGLSALVSVKRRAFS